MAIFADTDAHIEVNSVDLSGWVLSSNVNLENDTVETVSMGDSYVTTKPTFKRGSVSIEFQQDFAAAATDATIWAAFDAGVAVPFKYRPVSGTAIGTTNPEYTGNVVITEYAPSDQAAGEIASFSVTWPFDGAVSKATS